MGKWGHKWIRREGGLPRAHIKPMTQQIADTTCSHPELMLGIHNAASHPRYGSTIYLSKDCWLATCQDC